MEHHYRDDHFCLALVMLLACGQCKAHFPSAVDCQESQSSFLGPMFKDCKSPYESHTSTRTTSYKSNSSPFPIQVDFLFLFYHTVCILKNLSDHFRIKIRKIHVNNTHRHSALRCPWLFHALWCSSPKP